jgi:hypothetical protein
MDNHKRKAARCSGRHDGSVYWPRHAEYSAVPRGCLVVRGRASECTECVSDSCILNFDEGEWIVLAAAASPRRNADGTRCYLSVDQGSHFHFIDCEGPYEVVARRWYRAMAGSEAGT